MAPTPRSKVGFMSPMGVNVNIFLEKRAKLKKKGCVCTFFWHFLVDSCTLREFLFPNSNSGGVVVTLKISHEP